jgi:hypothetical protein
MAVRAMIYVEKAQAFLVTTGPGRMCTIHLGVGTDPGDQSSVVVEGRASMVREFALELLRGVEEWERNQEPDTPSD